MSLQANTCVISKIYLKSYTSGITYLWLEYTKTDHARNNVRGDKQAQLLRGNVMTGVWHRMQQKRFFVTDRYTYLSVTKTRLYCIHCHTEHCTHTDWPRDRSGNQCGCNDRAQLIENIICTLIWCRASSIDIENPGDASLQLVGSSNGFSWYFIIADRDGNDKLLHLG